MNWMGLFLFMATAVSFTVFGMILMGVIATKGRYEATTEAYKIGYEKGKKDEYERIGKLLDKYAEDLEKGGSNEGTKESDI